MSLKYEPVSEPHLLRHKINGEALSFRFQGGLVCKAHRLLYHSTLGLRVIKKQRGAELPRGFRSRKRAPERE